jgi:hypothetical protein
VEIPRRRETRGEGQGEKANGQNRTSRHGETPDKASRKT